VATAKVATAKVADSRSGNSEEAAAKVPTDSMYLQHVDKHSMMYVHIWMQHVSSAGG
jgi:hypothetical protein